MKILIATGIFPPDIGGPAIYSQMISRAFVQAGFPVRLITYSHWIENQEGDFCVTVIPKKLPKGLRHFAYFLVILKSAIYCDVIYAQNAVSAGLPAILCAKILRKRFVLKIVGDAAWERAQEKGMTENNLDVFQTEKCNFLIEILRKIQRHVTKNADAVIVPSIYLRNIVRGWGIEGDKINVIYNAIDPPGSVAGISKQDAKERVGLSGNIILSVGRLTKWKGLGALISIMPELLKQNPRFRLIIAGDGPLREDLRLKVKNLRLEDNIKLLGVVAHENLPLYFRAADMFVLNSSYEGLPHVVLEAMAAEVPVVATCAGGTPEVISDNYNGLLFPPNDTNALILKITRLSEDQELRNMFIRNSLKKLQDFQFSKMLSQTISILTAVSK